MAEPVAQQVARLQLEIQNLQAQLQARPPATKDMSLVALVPKWAGTDKAVPLHEFFEILESTARIGNWTHEDMIKIAILKLTDAARAFYSGTLELHDKKITWEAFKAAFRKRFRDVRTDQYHFTQLQMARQRRDESPQSFADRCRSLAQKIVPQVEDAALQKLHYEQADRMLLASFTSGLAGTPGRQVRYSMPQIMDEALKIAITVNQAEAQERRNEAFYVDEARGHVKSDRHTRGTRGEAAARKATHYAGAGRTQGQYGREPPKSAKNGDERRCYGSGGLGHYARECPTCHNRSNNRNSPSKRSDSEPQESARALSQEVSKRSKGRKNDTAAGKRVESRDSSFNVTVPENDGDNFVVRVKLNAGAPTLQAKVLGCHRAFIVDTGSSRSMLQ